MSLEREFQRAVKEGWIPHFLEAADRHGHRAEVLMGLASRETNMAGPEIEPGRYQWLMRPGDNGHGFGILQIDSRTDPEFARSGAWKQASAGILKGAEILALKRADLLTRAGTSVRLGPDSKGNQVTFTMPVFDPPMLERVSIAAFNAGLWPAYQASRGRDPDRSTTGKDYSKDVLERARAFATLLERQGHGNSTAPDPALS